MFIRVVQPSIGRSLNSALAPVGSDFAFAASALLAASPAVAPGPASIAPAATPSADVASRSGPLEVGFVIQVSKDFARSELAGAIMGLAFLLVGLLLNLYSCADDRRWLRRAVICRRCAEV